MIHLGDIPAGSTLYIPFATYDSNGASVTMSGLATSDILIYKNGSTTQRSSTSGFTLLDTDGIDFDSITGLHGISVDLSDNTDAGFFVAGSFYWVVISTVTVSTQTVTLVAATFRIVAAESVSGTPKADVSHFGGSVGTFSSGRPEVNTTHAAGTEWGSGAITAASIAADAITAAKIADGAIDSTTFAAGAINAAAIAADAITDAKVAADVTIASVTGAVGSVTGNVGGNVSGSVGSVVGAVGSVTGNVGGNVVGSVGSVTGFTPADITTIKNKTDSLTFTVAGQVDANIQYVNDVAVTGDGQSGTEWGP